MPQIFHPSMNTVSRATIFGAVFILAMLLWLTMRIVRSPYVSAVNVIKPQPVPFSHQHHVAECGIDCRYCHNSVEQSSFAGIPPTETCMNCHSHIWADSPMLEPVRASYRDDKPLVWNRVYDLPDFAYFNHSIHIHRGVACATCHGELAEMPLTWKASTLYMEWCLECHRQPERYIGPPEAVFASHASGEIPHAEADFGWENRRGTLLTNCSLCHF
jgi:Cytochrome c7 and related cytochrome c